MGYFDKAMIVCGAIMLALFITLFYVEYKRVERLDEMYAECVSTAKRDKFECHSLIYY